MPAAYDTYNYPAYWVGREYEHLSELTAIKSLLAKIPKVYSVLEIGAGYGRLTPSYLFRAKKAILSDPSAHLLKTARESYRGEKKIRFVQAGVDNLTSKIKPHTQDLVIMVRVLHHLPDLDSSLGTIRKLLKKRGYLILEFANKRHLKATIREFFKGNFTFPLDISTKDVRSKRSIRKKTIAFLNYHPDLIRHRLEGLGFEILSSLSVSNIRSKTVKKLLPTSFLVSIEKNLQKPLGFINSGPSVFILARKRG